MSDVKSKIWLRQSMPIYLKNILAKFHPDLIWNDGALGFFEEVTPTTTNRTRSVAIWYQFLVLKLARLLESVTMTYAVTVVGFVSSRSHAASLFFAPAVKELIARCDNVKRTRWCLQRWNKCETYKLIRRLETHIVITICSWKKRVSFKLKQINGWENIYLYTSCLLSYCHVYSSGK